MPRAVREDAGWWLAAAIDDYESAQLLFKGGKYSKCIHVLHNSAEKALKAAILAERKRPPRGAGSHNLVRLHATVAREAKLSPKLVRTLDDLAPLPSLRISRRCSRSAGDTIQKGAGSEVSQRSRRASQMAKETDIQRITKQYLQRLARNITVNKAILTGSWATGSYLEDSDIDLIVVSDDFSKMPIAERLNYLQKNWKNKIPLEAFGYTVEEFRKLSENSTYVKDAVRSGVVLVGTGSKHRGPN